MQYCTRQKVLLFQTSLTPSVVEYEYGKRSDIFVTLSNITNNTVIIPPKAILCELQPVTITGKTIQGNEEDIDRKREEIVNNLSMDKNEILDPDQKDKTLRNSY